MSHRVPDLLLKDMLEACERILAYVKGMNYDEFLADPKTKDAIVRNIQILGEAARQIPREIHVLHLV